MKLAEQRDVDYNSQMTNLHFWIAGILFLTWFLGFMIFNAGREIHLVFLAAVLIIVIKIVKEYIGNKNT